MQIEFGDVQQIVGIVKMGIAVCRELHKDGTLKEICDGASIIRRGIGMDTARLDVEKYQYYTEHGISPEHAILLLCVHKTEVIDSLRSSMDKRR